MTTDNPTRSTPIAPTSTRTGPRPPEGRPPGERRGAPEFEGYRGLASVLIVMLHVYQNLTTYSNGVTDTPFDGTAQVVFGKFDIVDIFFVLSAYLLSKPYVRAALDGGEPLAAREFLFRRAVRILPLYWGAVLLVWAIRSPAWPGDWRDLVEHLTLTQVFDSERIFYTLGPAWSLSLELGFYLVLALGAPTVVRRVTRLPRRGTRVAVLLAACAGLAAVSPLWRSFAWYVLHRPDDQWAIWFAPYARFTPFAVGMGLAVAAVAVRDRILFRGPWPALLRLAGLAEVVWAVSQEKPQTWGWLYYHELVTIGLAMIFASTVFGPTGQLWQRFFSWRPFLWLGLVSYSLYIWHEPIMVWLDDHVTSQDPQQYLVTAGVVLAFSLVAAWASYWCLEYPTSFLRRLRTRTGASTEYYPNLVPTGADGDSPATGTGAAGRRGVPVP